MEKEEQGMRITALLLGALTALAVQAEPNNTCWSDPVNIASVDIALASFSSNRAGAEARMTYSTNPQRFSAICNRSAAGFTMTHYVDMGPSLIPSDINPGYFKLSNDIDIRIASESMDSPGYRYFPLAPPYSLEANGRPPVGQGVVVNDFYVAGSGIIDLRLRRDIIGGAIVVPSNTELFSAYRIMNSRPFAPRASRPVVQARTRSGGQVIPVTPECSINQGNTISVNFGVLQTSRISSESRSDEFYSKDISLNFSCNTSLTQDIKVRLVADSADFSADLIRSDHHELGFLLKHNGSLVKPMGSFIARIEKGAGSESIALVPVKDPHVSLLGGEFHASATLVITSL
ncbi:TPA: fimbrial protein [Serratia rubidaea]|nr:fimbrial protein [Serratia rubidaea]HDJ1448120.1 fimbrial protein [Serratia rubidaea]HDJ1463131.1 fimbrial protein [Serratia rubidaea]HDJ2774425.1 fimbrial protein [Serratia rubidaea]